MSVEPLTVAVYHELALMLVRGSGTPRSSAQITAELERALHTAHADGLQAGRHAARREALLEVRQALAGAVSGLQSVDRTIERELDEGS